MQKKLPSDVSKATRLNYFEKHKGVTTLLTVDWTGERSYDKDTKAAVHL